MNLSDYEALSFDCYGTLIDWESGIGDVLVAWAADQSIDLDAERLLEVYATNEARVEAQTPTALYPEVLATAFRGVGEELGVPVSEDWAARLGRSVPDWPAFPDSREGLELLGRRYQLLILSNVDRAGFAASSECLGVTFDHVLTAEDVGSYKPANANFEALDRLRTDAGIPDGRLLHVAQSLFHDHVPAKQHGLSTVWINRRHDNPGWGATPEPDGDVQPDWTFPDLISFARAAV
jgi:2-haloalkanoic acid dehalogenase type II